MGQEDTDQVGSVRLVVKTDGTVAQRIDYDAWGRVIQNTPAGFQIFGFAGGILDVNAGLVQMGARWYDPVVGRFVKKDPSLFDGGFNFYAYANDDPVNFFDVTGNRPEGTGSWDFPAPPGAARMGDGGDLAMAGAGMCAIDGPAPIGDMIGIPAMIVGVLWATMERVGPFRKRAGCSLQGPQDPEPDAHPGSLRVCSYQCDDGSSYALNVPAQSLCPKWIPYP